MPAEMSEPVSAREHVLPVRVYWEDTDAGGIVYYANYLRYAERGRTELLRALGVEQRALAAETGLVFAVRRVEADYLAPARLDDALDVATSVSEARGASAVMRQEIRRGGETLVRLRVVIACVGERGRPTRFPPALARKFAQLAQAHGQGRGE